jgi:DNA processing protein
MGVVVRCFKEVFMSNHCWTAENTRELALALSLSQRHGSQGREEDWISFAERVRKDAGNLGVEIDLPGMPTYPTERLLSIRPSPVLFRKGEPLSYDRGVAVVGSRDADAYGLSVTRAFSGYLASRQVAIVSGGARGVDESAHRTALEEGGRTIAVLAGGLDRLSPASSRKTFSEMLRHGGTLVSESPPGVKPRPYFFPRRNRLIVALSDVVLVTQAARKSGCVHTAEAARKQQKPLFVVPGDICYHNSEGVNRMLEVGQARIALSPTALLESLGLLVHGKGHERPPCGHRKGWLPPFWQKGKNPSIILPEKASDMIVLTALSEEALSPSEISLLCHLPLHETVVFLARLEMTGRVYRLPGNRYVSVNKQKQ